MWGLPQNQVVRQLLGCILCYGLQESPVYSGSRQIRRAGCEVCNCSVFSSGPTQVSAGSLHR